MEAGGVVGRRHISNRTCRMKLRITPPPLFVSSPGCNVGRSMAIRTYRCRRHLVSVVTLIIPQELSHRKRNNNTRVACKHEQ